MKLCRYSNLPFRSSTIFGSKLHFDVFSKIYKILEGGDIKSKYNFKLILLKFLQNNKNKKFYKM